MKFKIIYFTVLVICMACKPSTKIAGERSETITLFNGKNLDNWRGDSRIWSAEDGCIVGRTTDKNQIAQNTFLIYGNSYSNFELTFQYKIIGGNSGVQYRSRVVDDTLFIVGGYQADMEAGVNHSGILYEEKGRGIIAKRGERVIIDENGTKTVDQFAESDEIQSKIRMEEWNDYRIVADGDHLMHFINGVKTIDVMDKEIEKRSSSGIIALQVHKGPNMEVYYRDMTLKPIHK